MRSIDIFEDVEIKEISFDKFWITWDDGEIYIDATYNKIACDAWALESYSMEIFDENGEMQVITDQKFIDEVLDQIEYQLCYY